MKEPEYNPLDWVMYNLGDNTYIGQVVAARYYDEEWHYTIDVHENSPHHVSEKSIVERCLTSKESKDFRSSK